MMSFLKKKELKKIIAKEIVEDKKFKEQEKEIDCLQSQFNEISDDFQKEKNKINSNFITYINDKFEEIKKNLIQEINIRFNKQFEEILNLIKNSHSEIINKCIQNQNIIKTDMKKIINDIGKIQNKLNIENVQNNNNVNIDNSNNNNNYNYKYKKLINKNQDNKNMIYFSSNTIPNNLEHKRYYNYNYLSNKAQNININPEEQSIRLKTRKIDKNLDKNNRNSYLFEDKNEYNSYNQLNNFLKNNTNNSNLIGNNPNNKKKIDNDKKKKKEETFKLKHNDIKVNDRNDKPKISNKANDQNQKLYQSINNVFFHDYQQKYIKDQKISEYKKEELQKEIFNDKVSGRNILKNYYMNFIEENILPLFKKNKNIIQSKLEIIKHNISVILECLGIDKNYYNNYYYQYETTNKNKFNRYQSQEAVLRFRREFNISKEDFKDEALENKLIENNLDIYKTFGKIFG